MFLELNDLLIIHGMKERQSGNHIMKRDHEKLKKLYETQVESEN